MGRRVPLADQIGGVVITASKRSRAMCHPSLR